MYLKAEEARQRTVEEFKRAVSQARDFEARMKSESEALEEERRSNQHHLQEIESLKRLVQETQSDGKGRG